MFSRKVAIPEPQAEPADAKSRHAAEEQVEQPNVSHPVTPRTPLTPSSISSSSEEANNERGMVVHEKNNELVPADKQNNALSLVTVRSMSQEERDKLTHLEVTRKMSQIEAVHGKEAEVWLEKQMRDALAEQFHMEAKAEKKYEDEISTIKYREAQLKKKIENKLAQAMVERTRLEILARQKLEERKTKAKTLAEERIAAAKARASAIRTGAVKAELISTRRRFSMRW
jgi:hypothetical protein